jgi:predicted chitinase/predicted house-cleaning noncanonical NTP pyrophosphatase (MazG superfamily)
MAGEMYPPVSEEVAAQIAARKKIIEKKSGRTSEDLLYMNSKTGWVKMSSSVNTLSPEQVSSLRAGVDPTSITGDPKLAGYNILLGGTLRPDRGLRQGIDTKPTDAIIGQSSAYAYQNRAASTGIRPMPGITSMSVKSKNTYGTLREAEVKFSVWTLEDFEIMERIYLRPGFTVLLEWGHSMYVDNNGVLHKDIESIGNHFFNPNVTMSQLLVDIGNIRKKTSYNYEGMIGYIKNFSWTYNSEGGYECSVSIISTGEILESLQLRFNPRHRVEKDKFDDKESEEGKEQRKSILHFIMQKLTKLTSENTFTKADLEAETGTVISDLEDFTGYYADTQLDGGWFGLDTDTPMHWISMRTLFDIFNKCIIPMDLSKPKGTPDRTLTRFNIDYEKSSTFLTSPEHFSIDPTVCVLAFPSQVVADKWYGPVNAKLEIIPIHTVEGEIVGNKNDVLNIYISIPYLKSVLDSALDDKGKLNKSIHDITETLLEGVNNTLGGINDIVLTYDEEDGAGTWFLVDRNNTPADNVPTPEFTLAGIGSVFTEVGISSKISNEIASQISIAAQGSAKNTTENIENILRWNPDVVDRVKVTKSVSEVEAKGKEEVAADIQERTKEWLTDVVELFDKFNSNDGYKKEDMEALKTMHAEWTINNVVKKYRTQNRQPIPEPIPVELSFKTDGIGGFKIAETFKIAPGILPSKYQGKFGYLITGLEHTVGVDNRWETSVTTQFFIIEKPTDAEVDAVGQVPGESLATSRDQSLQDAGIVVTNKPSKTPPTPLVEAMKAYGITNPKEKAHFLAQCAHESGNFAWTQEFATGAAYEGRKDLGNTQSGDGRKYKGRGYIQITGRANYQKYANFLKAKGVKDDIMSNPNLVATKFAADSACYWWKYLSRGIGSLANAGASPTHVKSVTKRVNGGTNGLADRQTKFNDYWAKLSKNPTAYS